MNANVTIPIIKQIEETVKQIPGWSPVDQLYTLFNLVFLTGPLDGDIVEIGSWCGRSAVVLGMASLITGKTKIHCIDLFPEKDDWKENADGSFSFDVTINGKTYGGYQEQTVWREPFLKDIAPLYEKFNGVYDIFIQSIRTKELDDIVVAFKGDSNDFFSKAPNTFKCKLAFVDGDHSYIAVCNDISNIEKHLVMGGWICFDDAFSHYEGVNRAIQDKIINSGNYAHCQQMTRKFFVAQFKGK